jgi:hypothetical protein
MNAACYIYSDNWCPGVSVKFVQIGLLIMCCASKLAAAAAAAAAGQHQGTPIKDLDAGFVRWSCTHFDFNSQAKQVLLQQLVEAGKVRQGPSGQLTPLGR